MPFTSPSPDIKTPTLLTGSVLGSRDPWDLLFEAGRHLIDQMSVVRGVIAWGVPPEAILEPHRALFQAHSLIHDCLSLINQDGGAK